MKEAAQDGRLSGFALGVIGIVSLVVVIPLSGFFLAGFNYAAHPSGFGRLISGVLVLLPPYGSVYCATLARKRQLATGQPTGVSTFALISTWIVLVGAGLIFLAENLGSVL